MKEIGGYIEFENFHREMFHEGGILLNSGRDCFLYLILAHSTRKVWIPYFLGDTIQKLCHKENIEFGFYHINEKWLPADISIGADECLYLVNYYGQLARSDIENLKIQYENIILDNTQAYFNSPLDGIDTLYSCRKYFGLPDGGILFTDKRLDNLENYSQEVSYSRMNFLLGRYEKNASEFYQEYVANNDYFDKQPMKRMSKLTRNLLHGIDYEFVKHRRTENFKYLHKIFWDINRLQLKIIEGAFAYPLMLSHGGEIRKQLIKNKIYIPVLWPNVLNECAADSLEYKLAADVLPLPVDQRYGLDDMKYMANIINSLCNVQILRKWDDYGKYR